MNWADAFKTTASFLGEIVESVFSSETAMSALSGALIGGITAAITGEDVVDGALLGGGVGAVFGTADNYMKKLDAESATSEIATASTLDGQGPLITEGKQPTTSGLSDGLDLVTQKPSGVTSMVMQGVTPESAKILNADLAPVSPYTTSAIAGSPSDSAGLLGRVKTGWGNLKGETQAAIVGQALGGVATAYSANKQAESASEEGEKNRQALLDRDAAQYDRTKAKGGTSGAKANFTLNQPIYQNSRLNPERLA